MVSEPSTASLLATAAIQLRSGAIDAAIETYRAALSRNDRLPDAWFNLGWLYRATRQFPEALEAYGKSIESGVARAEECHLNRAAILSDHLLRADDARSELDRALQINPRFVAAWLNLANLDEDLGRKDDAREAYRAALAIAPDNGRAAARLAMLDMVDGRPDVALRDLRGALQTARDVLHRRDLLFALGQVLDSTGEYPAAFAACEQANGIARTMRHARYDAAAMERLVSDIIAAFPRLPSPANAAPARPVFICGMFRSGSTLVEQLLARHPSIVAGGENEFVPATALTMGENYPRMLATMSPRDFQPLRERYLSELANTFPIGDHVTDKRCDNFLHIGLIRSIFPNAVIVHTIRRPIDTLTSLYFTDFDDGVTYADDLSDMAHHYTQYRRMMNHWEALDDINIIRVNYDHLVRNPRQSIQPVLDRLCLPWVDQCAVPEAEPRQSVRTASAWQVRQPLHHQSSGRWQHYRPQLATAWRILEQAGVPPDGI